ncbi:hypothetical protein V502_08636 [Pseudogymnoascus sp. VKM F-4520 (FW-2644)]|nr:hypothetical protein V502_08636 [Pseudogymnoascus sp. VKM F-4520 (FW-2644)]
MPSPRNSSASSTYSYSTTSTTDTIRDTKKSNKTPSPKKDSFLQKTKRVLAGPSPEEEAARKADRTPTQAMMEKYGAGRGNIMGPH